jgi:hypothetical protein
VDGGPSPAKTTESRDQRRLVLSVGVPWFGPTEAVVDCRDAKHTRYLGLMPASAARMFVSGDGGVPILERWRGRTIVRPGGFLEVVERVVLALTEAGSWQASSSSINALRLAIKIPEPVNGLHCDPSDNIPDRLHHWLPTKYWTEQGVSDDAAPIRPDQGKHHQQTADRQPGRRPGPCRPNWSGPRKQNQANRCSQADSRQTHRYMTADQ